MDLFEIDTMLICQFKSMWPNYYFNNVFKSELTSIEL